MIYDISLKQQVYPGVIPEQNKPSSDASKIKFSAVSLYDPGFDPKDSSWRSGAICYGIDPNIIMPEYYDDQGNNRPNKQELLQLQKRVAEEICTVCPVRRSCLSYAVNSNETMGVWGGEIFDNNTAQRIKNNKRRSNLRHRLSQVPISYLTDNSST